MMAISEDPVYSDSSDDELAMPRPNAMMAASNKSQKRSLSAPIQPTEKIEKSVKAGRKMEVSINIHFHFFCFNLNFF